MPDARHNLTTSRREQPSDKWDGGCSCGKLVMRNKTKAEIRERYDEHVQTVLGPGRGEIA